MAKYVISRGLNHYELCFIKENKLMNSSWRWTLRKLEIQPPYYCSSCRWDLGLALNMLFILLTSMVRPRFNEGMGLRCTYASRGQPKTAFRNADCLKELSLPENLWLG